MRQRHHHLPGTVDFSRPLSQDRVQLAQATLNTMHSRLGKSIGQALGYEYLPISYTRQKVLPNGRMNQTSILAVNPSMGSGRKLNMFTTVDVDSPDDPALARLQVQVWDDTLGNIYLVNALTARVLDPDMLVRHLDREQLSRLVEVHRSRD